MALEDDFKNLARVVLRDTGYQLGEKEGQIFHYTFDLWQQIGLSEEVGTKIVKFWAKRGWYEYEVSLRTGWLTQKGRKALIKIISSA